MHHLNVHDSSRQCAFHWKWYWGLRRLNVQVSLDKAKAKSEAVVGQEDVPMKSKMKEVQKIYAKARAAAGQGGAKGDKKKKAGTGRRRDEHKSKGRPLDGRMLSDKRETGAKVLSASCRQPPSCHMLHHFQLQITRCEL
jgi:hypothetical protein